MNPCKPALQSFEEALFLSRKKKLFYRAINPFHHILKWLLKESPAPSNRKFSKILISNQGAIGDVFLSTMLIPTLKRSYPDCQISLLLSGEGTVAGSGCPGVSNIHLFDHWITLPKGGGQRVGHFFHFHLIGKRRLIAQLKKEGYDCVLHLFPFFADLLPIYYRAKIPVRVAFDTGGYQTFATHLIEWECGRYLLDHYQKFLERLGIAFGDGEHLETPWTEKMVNPLEEEGYVIFHIGSKNPQKELPISFWKELLQEFTDRGEKVYFTGLGDRENHLIEEVITHESQNLVGRFTFLEWIGCLAGARLVVSVDSASVHIAAAIDTPVIAFYKDVHDPDLWRPEVKGYVCQAVMPMTREGAEVVTHFDPKQVMGFFDRERGALI